MSILITSFFHEEYEVFGDYYYDKTSFIKIDERYEINMSGDLIDITELDIVKAVQDNNYLQLIDSFSEFSVVILDKKEVSIKIITDLLGRNIVYIHDDDEFVVSNDLFSMAGELRRIGKKIHIDIAEALCQIFIFSSPSHSTFLNGVKIAPPATVISKKKNSPTNENVYFEFARDVSDSIDNQDEKIEKLFNLFDLYFKKLSEKHKNCTFGVGISGGLDSRIIPYFALRNGIKLDPFIICEGRGKRSIESNDFKRASEIADYFDISLTKKLSFPKKDNFTAELRNRLALDCINSPLTASQIFKLPVKESFNFNRLLTGASGFIVGSSPFYNATKEMNILDVLRERQTGIKLRPKFFRLKKAMNYFIPGLFNLKEEITPDILKVVEKNKIDYLLDSLRKFCIQRANRITQAVEGVTLDMTSLDCINGVKKIDIMMSYAVNILGQRNLAGGFESLGGTKDAYTIYNGRILKEVMDWTNNDIYERNLFENLIKSKMPELAQIKAQTHKSSISKKRGNIFRRLSDTLLFAIRGQGVMNYDNWYRSKEFQKFIKAEVDDSSPINRVLNFNELNKLVMSKKMSSIVALNSLKLNRIMLMLEEYNGKS